MDHVGLIPPRSNVVLPFFLHCCLVNSRHRHQNCAFTFPCSPDFYHLWHFRVPDSSKTLPKSLFVWLMVSINSTCSSKSSVTPLRPPPQGAKLLCLHSISRFLHKFPGPKQEICLDCFLPLPAGYSLGSLNLSIKFSSFFSLCLYPKSYRHGSHPVHSLGLLPQHLFQWCILCLLAMNWSLCCRL